MMGTFEVGQEVVLLDGTSLIGHIIKISETADAYKVSVNGSEGRWYEAAEIGAIVYMDIAPADAPAQDAAAKLRQQIAKHDAEIARIQAKRVAQALGDTLGNGEDDGGTWEQDDAIATLQAENARLQAQVAALTAALDAMYDEDLAMEYGNLCQRYPYEPRINLFERVYGERAQGGGGE